MGPVVYIKTYIFNHFYLQYLVLLTMFPRNINIISAQSSGGTQSLTREYQSFEVPTPRARQSTETTGKHYWSTCTGTQEGGVILSI